MSLFVSHIVLLLISLTVAVRGQGCCQTKEVTGDDDLVGTYTLYNGQATFLDVCQDQCAYTRDGNPDSSQLFCFRTEGATHNTVCTVPGATTPSSGSGGSGSCPYSKDNVSWAEYQVTIPMPSSGTSAPYTVVLTFDADTTIGSCHSGCQSSPSCSGSVCTVTYTQSGGSLQMFNVKKVGFTGENDRSNLVSVTINGIEQC